LPFETRGFKIKPNYNWTFYDILPLSVFPLQSNTQHLAWGAKNLKYFQKNKLFP